jgi:hypothetical protein
MAYVNRKYTQEGTQLRIFPLPSGDRSELEKDKRRLAVGDKVLVAEEAVVLSRFPMEEEAHAAFSAFSPVETCSD